MTLSPAATRSGKRTLWVVQEVKKIQLRQVVNTPDPSIMTASPMSAALTGPCIASQVRPTPMRTAAHLLSATGETSRRQPAPATRATAQRRDGTGQSDADNVTTRSGPILRPIPHPKEPAQKNNIKVIILRLSTMPDVRQNDLP